MRSRAANSEVSDRILPKFILIQAFMADLVTCQNEEDPLENEGTRVFTTFLPLLVYGDFSKRSRAANSSVLRWILSNFDPIRDFISVLVACKNEKDPIKNEGARVVTTLFIDFSHAQGQLTLKSVIESCQNSNSSKLLWLTLLPARMKKIHWKMKVLEWSQRFSHYKSMGIFPNAQGQLTHKSFVGYCPISNPSEILCVSLLPARIKKNQQK